MGFEISNLVNFRIFQSTILCLFIGTPILKDPWELPINDNNCCICCGGWDLRHALKSQSPWWLRMQQRKHATLLLDVHIWLQYETNLTGLCLIWNYLCNFETKFTSSSVSPRLLKPTPLGRSRSFWRRWIATRLSDANCTPVEMPWMTKLDSKM